MQILGVWRITSSRKSCLNYSHDLPCDFCVQNLNINLFVFNYQGFSTAEFTNLNIFECFLPQNFVILYLYCVIQYLIFIIIQRIADKWQRTKLLKFYSLYIWPPNEPDVNTILHGCHYLTQTYNLSRTYLLSTYI